ncbi:hypothetical protein niasHT_004362 [Heterodera trifolii]|uniref:Uncharacterized protein n=1 Tax=Heterodera trifolii TaxID=157864 RepID=A0ABD2MBB8_9BILA
MPVVTPHHANNSNEWREKYENSALWPLCLIVVSIDHRSEQPTPSGTFTVTNVVLRNGDGNRVEASGRRWCAGVSDHWKCLLVRQLLRASTVSAIGLLVSHQRRWKKRHRHAEHARPVCAKYPSNFNCANCQLVVVVLFLKQMPLPLMRTKTTIRLTIVLVSPCVHVLLNDGLLRGRIGQLGIFSELRGQHRCATRSETHVVKCVNCASCRYRMLSGPTSCWKHLSNTSLIASSRVILDRCSSAYSSTHPASIALMSSRCGHWSRTMRRLLAAAIERLNEQSSAGIDLLAGTTVTKVLAAWPLESIRADAQRGGACALDDEHHISNNVQSLVRIVNPDDRHCLARSVLIGLRDLETRMANGGGRDAFTAYAQQQDQHRPEALTLLRRAGLPVNKDMYTQEDGGVISNDQIGIKF